MDAHEYICFFFQNLNILCSFWSIDSFSEKKFGPIRFRIFGVDQFDPSTGSHNIAHDKSLHG
jgi:hypothetical protein